MEVKIIEDNGAKLILIDGKTHSPLAFRSFRPNQNNVKAFYDAGIRLMSILCTGLKCYYGVPYSHFGEHWVGIGKYDFSTLDSQVDMFIAQSPEAYFNIMLELDTRDWYLNLHSDFQNSYWELLEMAHNEQWKLDAAQYLRDTIDHIESKYGDKVFGYTIMAGRATEWFTHDNDGRRAMGKLPDSETKVNAYRKYVNSQSASLPDIDVLNHTSRGNLRDPVKDKESIDYWKFHNESVGDLIAYFAQVFQDKMNHKKLLGIFYGYIMIPEWRLNEGHSDIDSLLKNNNIDMVYAPTAYDNPRSFEGASAFLRAVESDALHGKLFFNEIDIRTHLASNIIDGIQMDMAMNDKLYDEFHSIAVLRRDFAMCQAKRCGMWWFDFFGGYYDSPTMMKLIKDFVQIDKELHNISMESVSQVAVIIDADALFYMNHKSGLYDKLVLDNREQLNRMGAPYNTYHLCDLENIANYKLYIFLNTIKIEEEQKKYIQNVLQKNGSSVLWIYKPGVIFGDTYDEERIADVTGINTKGECDVLENQNEKVSYKQFEDYTCFYCEETTLSADMFREIAQMSGVHIYNFDNLPIYANSKLLATHNPNGGKVLLKIPNADKFIAEDLYNNKQRIYCNNGILEADTGIGEVKLYLLHMGGKENA